MDWSVTAGSAGTVTFDAGAVCTTGFAGSNPCTARTVTKGDFVGAVESSAFGNVLTCTDTLGDAFTYTANFAASPTVTQFCIAQAKSTGTNTVNLAQSGSSNVYGFDFQFTGTNGINQDTGLPNGVALINPEARQLRSRPGNFTAANAGDLIISWMRDGGSTAFTNGTGYTYLGGSSGAGCNTAVTLCVEYLIGRSSGTNAATWTDSASTTTWKVGALAVTAGTSQVATVNTNGVVTPHHDRHDHGCGQFRLRSPEKHKLHLERLRGNDSLLHPAVKRRTGHDCGRIGWQDATATVGTPTDSAGNTYTLVQRTPKGTD